MLVCDVPRYFVLSACLTFRRRFYSVFGGELAWHFPQDDEMKITSMEGGIAYCCSCNSSPA